MASRISYPSTRFLAATENTPTRREDTERGTTWTNEEVKWLWENYSRFPCRFIAEYLRRSELSVRLKIHRLRFGRADRQQKDGNVSQLAPDGRVYVKKRRLVPGRIQDAELLMNSGV